MKIECTQKNKKTGRIDNVGFLEIKNQSEEKAELYIYGDIVRDEWYKWSDDDTCPQDVTYFLKELDKSQNIDIFINSGGGSVHGGLAIYNQLKRHNGYKTVHIDGIAASIASVISCAGDKVIIPSNAQFMIHKPSVCLWDNMNADDLRKEADILDVCQDSIMNIYMQNVKDGVTREQVEEMVNNETWFTGDKAAEIFNFEVEESYEAVASASSLYKNYKNVPKGLENKSFFNAQKPQMSEETKKLLEECRSMQGFEDFDKKFK